MEYKGIKRAILLLWWDFLFSCFYVFIFRYASQLIDPKCILLLFWLLFVSFCILHINSCSFWVFFFFFFCILKEQQFRHHNHYFYVYMGLYFLYILNKAQHDFYFHNHLIGCLPTIFKNKLVPPPKQANVTHAEF